MKSQKQGLSAQEMTNSIVEKVLAAEEALAACQDAEMPFLKGIEARHPPKSLESQVLPPEESSKAIGDCEAAGVGAPKRSKKRAFS